MFSQQQTQVSNGGYQISRSLRFNSADSAYLNRTPPIATNQKTWTWSAWIKLSKLNINQYGLFSTRDGTGNRLTFGIQADNTLTVYGTDGTVAQISLTTTQVFRDPSSWYHIIFAVDTTQSTASNRARLYINGIEVTSFSTATYPTQNLDLAINRASEHSIGQYTLTGNYVDGYMTEINFVDGQQLTPSSFGETNAQTGVWQPKAYLGLYGINGFYVNFSDNSNTTSTTLGRDHSSLQNLVKYSEELQNAAWTKAGQMTVTGNYAASPTGTMTASRLVYTGGDYGFVQQVFSNVNGANTPYTFSIWLKSNTGSNYTARLKSTHGGITDNFSSDFTVTPTWQKFTFSVTNGASAGTSQIVGVYSNSTLTAYDILAWGAQLTTGSTIFPYTKTDASTIGGNNWTPNNFSVAAGLDNDSVVDTPTPYGGDNGLGGEVRGNYCTLNPISIRRSFALSNGNLSAINNGFNDGVSTGTMMLPKTGKWYWEAIQGAWTSQTYLLYTGILSKENFPNDSFVNNPGAMIYPRTSNVCFYNNGSGSCITETTFANDVFGVAFDADAGIVKFYKNGVYYSGQDVTVTTSADYYPFLAVGNQGISASINFGQRPFAYPAPSGYKCLCTTNLPTPTIGATTATQAGKYFNTVLWTGNGVNPRSITGVGFQPDFSFLARRDVGYGTFIYDAVRGAANCLSSQVTDAQRSYSQLNSFDVDGFTQAGSVDQGNNISGGQYVAWNWKAGDSNITNTSGTITSTVRANPTNGFSIVTFTGNGVAGATVGHGLGAAPKMIIVKSITNARNWLAYHSSIGATQFLQLDTTIGATTATTPWNDTAPTSTVFSLGTSLAGNESGVTRVAYCFTEIPGFSKIGSYIGNGSTDGPFVYCGFKPKFIMWKNAISTTQSGNWTITDSVRSPYNVSKPFINANDAVAENASYEIVDILSNGFKLKYGGGGSMNFNGDTYVFIAFAENPFKYSLAR